MNNKGHAGRTPILPGEPCTRRVSIYLRLGDREMALATASGEALGSTLRDAIRRRLGMSPLPWRHSPGGRPAAKVYEYRRGQREREARIVNVPLSESEYDALRAHVGRRKVSEWVREALDAMRASSTTPPFKGGA